MSAWQPRSRENYRQNILSIATIIFMFTNHKVIYIISMLIVCILERYNSLYALFRPCCKRASMKLNGCGLTKTGVIIDSSERGAG